MKYAVPRPEPTRFDTLWLNTTTSQKKICTVSDGPHSRNIKLDARLKVLVCQIPPTTRSTERHTDTRFPTIKTSVACVMSSLSEETMMLTLVGAETTPRALTRARPGLCASVEWRRDARVLRSLPLHAPGVFGSPPLGAITHAGSRVPLGQDWQLGRSLFGMPARGPSRPLPTFGQFLGRPPFFQRLPSSSVGLPATTLSIRPYSSTTLVFTLEGDFNLDNSITPACLWARTVSTSPSRAGDRSCMLVKVELSGNTVGLHLG